MSKKTLTTIIVSVVIIIIILLGLVAFFSSQKSSKKTDTQQRYQIYVIKTASPLIESGKVVAKQTQDLNNPDGSIVSIAVKNGDKVEKGTVLLTTYNTNAASEIKTTQQAISKDNRDLSAQKQSVSDLKNQLSHAGNGEKGNLQSNLTQAQNTQADTEVNLQNEQDHLKQLENKLYGKLTAPFDAVVSIAMDKNGQPQLSISSTSLELEASVSEYDYGKLHVGGSISVRALANGTKQKSTIAFISTLPSKTTSRQNLSMYDFTADVGNQFINGQSVQVTIPQNEIKIPGSALMKRNDQTVVYVVRRGIAELQTVTVQKYENYYLVAKGLKVNDRLVLNPDNQIKNGLKVR